MSWLKLDDGFYDHPKFVGISAEAFMLWVRSAGYANRHLTDGFVPKEIARAFANGERGHVDELIRRQLWRTVPDGYQFHDWLDWNPSRSQVQERRRREAERQRDSYHKRKGLRTDSPETSRATGGKSHRNSPRVVRPVNERDRENAQVRGSDVYANAHPPLSKDPYGSFESAGAREGAPPALQHEPVDREHQREMARRTLGPLREELAAKRRAKLAQNDAD